MRARVTVSLGALADNYELLKTRSGSAVAGVVKANGYGLGAERIARRLYAAGCRTFFVAQADEGVALRAAFPEAEVTIFILEGAYSESQSVLAEHRLVPVLNTVAQAKSWGPMETPAAVHIDTGMQRLGIPPAEVETALGHLQRAPELLMTHFARADEEDPESSLQQAALFQDLVQPIFRRFGRVPVSLSNSAAALAGDLGDDIVRGGMALYGANPFVSAPNPTRPVANW